MSHVNSTCTALPNSLSCSDNALLILAIASITEDAQWCGALVPGEYVARHAHCFVASLVLAAACCKQSGRCQMPMLLHSMSAGCLQRVCLQSTVYKESTIVTHTVVLHICDCLCMRISGSTVAFCSTVCRCKDMWRTLQTVYQ